MRRLLAPGLLLLALVSPVRADPPASAFGRSGTGAEVSLIDGWQQPDGSRVAAVEIRLDPAWHTYFRVPGEAGVPPAFDWSESENLASVRYEWPRPEIIDNYGMRSFGYVGRLVLPVLLTPKDPSAPMRVSLSLSFGVCNDVCIQEDRRVATRFASDGEGDAGAGRPLIEAALAERARSADEAGVARVTCAVAPDGDGYALTAAVTFDRPPPGLQAVVLETAQPGLWIGDAESGTAGATVTARATLAGPGGAVPAFERQALRVTVLDEGRAVDIRGCEAPG
jgi:DsbC/DsbD-like thiol-disulfide interchange protein